MSENAARRRLWQLHTRVSIHQGTPVLALEGRVGHAATAQLEAAAETLLAGAPRVVIIDLSGIDYLSSAALKVFKGLAEDQDREGGRLILRAPSVAARLALELSGLLELVDSLPG